MYSLSANTLIESAKLNQNFTDLASGDADVIGNSLETFRDETFFDFVLSGGIWTADSAGSNKNASMSAMVIVINGIRIPVSSVTARVFTASKDTYIDILSNGDGTGTIVYTEVSNNAASPSLAANSVRMGIIVTGATTIATANSVNQGQEDRILPIASSIKYAVTDSLGNLICPRDPNRKLLGVRQITTGVSAGTSVTLVTGLTCPVIVPTGRKVKVTVSSPQIVNGATVANTVGIWDGTVGSGTLILDSIVNTVNNGVGVERSITVTPAATSKTYNAALTAGSGSATFGAGSTSPAFIRVELE